MSVTHLCTSDCKTAHPACFIEIMSTTTTTNYGMLIEHVTKGSQNTEHLKRNFDGINVAY